MGREGEVEEEEEEGDEDEKEKGWGRSMDAIGFDSVAASSSSSFFSPWGKGGAERRRALAVLF